MFPMPTDVDDRDNEPNIALFIKHIIPDPTWPQNYITRVKEIRGKGATKGCEKVAHTEEELIDKLNKDFEDMYMRVLDCLSLAHKRIRVEFTEHEKTWIERDGPLRVSDARVEALDLNIKRLVGGLLTVNYKFTLESFTDIQFLSEAAKLSNEFDTSLYCNQKTDKKTAKREAKQKQKMQSISAKLNRRQAEMQKNKETDTSINHITRGFKDRHEFEATEFEATDNIFLPGLYYEKEWIDFTTNQL